MTRPISHFARRRRWLSGPVLAALVVVPGIFMAGHQVERRGLAFYQTGRASVASLEELETVELHVHRLESPFEADRSEVVATVRFEAIGTPRGARWAGTDLLRNSRGIAVADFWNRGALDVDVAASADRHALLANLAGGGVGRRGWLQVEAVGAGDALPDGSNLDGVGARITVGAGG